MSFTSPSPSKQNKDGKGGAWTCQLYFDYDADKPGTGNFYTDPELKTKLKDYIGENEAILKVSYFKHPLYPTQVTAAPHAPRLCGFWNGPLVVEYWEERRGNLNSKSKEEDKCAGQVQTRTTHLALVGPDFHASPGHRVARRRENDTGHHRLPLGQKFP